MMKKILVMVVMITITIACSGESTSDSTTNAGPEEIDVKKLWKIRCMACHGLKGNQGLNGAANLQEVDISLAERLLVIQNGKQGNLGVMPGFGDVLSEEAIEALAKHTMTFNENLD